MTFDERMKFHDRNSWFTDMKTDVEHNLISFPEDILIAYMLGNYHQYACGQYSKKLSVVVDQRVLILSADPMEVAMSPYLQGQGTGFVGSNDSSS